MNGTKFSLPVVCMKKSKDRKCVVKSKCSEDCYIVDTCHVFCEDVVIKTSKKAHRFKGGNKKRDKKDHVSKQIGELKSMMEQLIAGKGTQGNNDDASNANESRTIGNDVENAGNRGADAESNATEGNNNLNAVNEGVDVVEHEGKAKGKESEAKGAKFVEKSNDVVKK